MSIVIGMLGLVGAPICLIILIIRAICKKPIKRVAIIMVVFIVCFIVGIVTTPTRTHEEIAAYNAEKAESDRLAAERAKLQEEADCAERERIEAEESAQEEAERLEAAQAEADRLAVTFDEIYYAYKENELRADDAYQYNRYRITAKINGINADGLLNLTGGATLTMEKLVGNTTVFFFAEFEEEQEEALKTVNVGDTITFEGKCLSAGSWSDCELVLD